MKLLGLSEDGSRGAPEVVRLLALRAFRCAVPEVQTHKVAFTPGVRAPLNVIANAWKDVRADASAMLMQEVAARVSRGEWVVVHVDGDVPWSRRKEGENDRLFHERFVARVRQVLEQHHKDTAAADRVIPMMPFHEVEAWTYQATDKAVELLHAHHRGLGVDVFAAWKADRAALDEVEDVKSTTPLKGEHNAALAQAFPAEDVDAVGKSFHAFVEEIRARPALMGALRATAAWSPS